MNATQNNQNGMTELIISVIEPVKRRGRPTGSKNRPYYQTDFTVHKTEVEPKKNSGDHHNTDQEIITVCSYLIIYPRTRIVDS
jgi:hypothetical protein